MTTHKLLGAEVSLYTGKVRTYLRYKGVPFEEIAATREVYKTVIVPRTGVRFIPVLISDEDVAVQDSTAIIDFLEQRYPSPPIYPDGAVQRLVALLFEVYADEWLLIPAMHYRWSLPENRQFAIGEFGKLSAPELSEAEQRALGEKLSVPFAGALPALGIDGRTSAAIEASYLALLRELDDHFAEQPFLLGSRPSIGDFALMGPLYAHLYRDPASGRLMRREAPRVAAWVERMNAPTPGSGRFLADDCIPETLEPLLRRMFREQGPVLRSTIARLSTWQSEADAPLPRTLGTHSFAIDGSCGERNISPFNVWRWQRPYDCYHQLEGAAHARADALLTRVDGLSLLHTPLSRRLLRVDNRLRLADA